ncbi:hypothetical protein, partial [Klebsiella aerogenes]|uniref:hypothetical protein n=1 Tax=Klebsiella aerogenes TaxID=548 RepID=UPI001A8FE0AD
RKVVGEFNENQLDKIFFDEICTCQLQKITKHFYDIDSLAPIDSSVGRKLCRTGSRTIRLIYGMPGRQNGCQFWFVISIL